MAGPSRSSRAISEACKLAGTARAGDGTAATVRRASPSLSASSTAFVISSTNSGMPSVRSTISADHIRRQLLVPDKARDDGGRFTLPKPVERQARHMRLSHPRRVELGAESYDEQRRKSFNPVHRPAERFEARRIDPMRILEDHQHRLLACQSRKLRRQRLQRSLPALLRGQFERGIASIIRQRQHLGKERGILRRGRGLRQQRIELVELRLRCVVVRQSGGTFHLADDRIKRAVGVLRRAEIAQARVRFGRRGVPAARP